MVDPRGLRSLTLILSPSGHVALARDDEAVDGEPARAGVRDDGTEARIEGAFARGGDAGLFDLGAVEVESDLPPVLAFFRLLARDLVTALCREPDLEARRGDVTVTPDPRRLDALLAQAPPMRGGEYLSRACLAALFEGARAFFVRDVAAYDGTVEGYLRAKSPAWNLVGRVFFHLAENKGDPHRPFAFLATHTTHAPGSAKPAHVPLGRALERAVTADDRTALRALLAPVHRAAAASPVVRAMVDADEIYHPLAWTSDEAYAFLRELPALEASGVVVRVPDWWKDARSRRPEVRVTLGGRAPTVLGAEALLDFDVDVTLAGEPLTPSEMQDLLRASSGLALVRGRWVEVDAARLRGLLDHWKIAETAVRHEGMSFLEGMRLLAGFERLVKGSTASTARESESASENETGREIESSWHRVTAGPWLAAVLEGLRSPDGLAARGPGDALRATLRPYQEAGVRWLLWLYDLGLGGCLADDMGLGKTVQVLAFLLCLKAKGEADPRPALLVVPASLLGTWASEAARFAPSLRIVTAHGSPSAAADALEGDDAPDVVLTTYGTVTRTPAFADRVWRVVVLDEAQAIKNPSAQQSRAAKRLRARARFALTGTPVENRIGDLFSLFDMVAPGLLGTPADQARTVRALAKSPAHYTQLRALVSPYILRRLKTDPRVQKDLPPKTEMRALCPLTRTQAALYVDAVAALEKKLARTGTHADDAGGGIARRGAVLASLLVLKQICNHPSQIRGDGIYAPGESGKLTRLLEIAREIAERQEKMLVFTQFREMTAPLAKGLESVFGTPGLVLHGSVAVKARRALVDAFQAEDGPPFFVLSLKAGGTGLTLTAASHVVHFDRWWNPAVEDQATDRAYRIGQTRPVMVHKLVCRGTVEERVDALIADKRALAEGLLEGGDEIPLTEMSNEALLRMVSLDIRSAEEGAQTE